VYHILPITCFTLCILLYCILCNMVLFHETHICILAMEIDNNNIANDGNTIPVAEEIVTPAALAPVDIINTMPPALVDKWVRRFHRPPGEFRGLYLVPDQICAQLACETLLNDPKAPKKLGIYCEEYLVSVTRQVIDDVNMQEPAESKDTGDKSPIPTPNPNTTTETKAYCKGLVVARANGWSAFFNLDKLGGVPDFLINLLTDPSVMLISHYFGYCLDNVEPRLNNLTIDVDVYDLLEDIKHYQPCPTLSNLMMTTILSYSLNTISIRTRPSRKRFARRR